MLSVRVCVTCANESAKTAERIRLHQIYVQVALLSQRGCAMPRVIEYFAKSLKVIRNETVE